MKSAVLKSVFIIGIIGMLTEKGTEKVKSVKCRNVKL